MVKFCGINSPKKGFTQFLATQPVFSPRHFFPSPSPLPRKAHHTESRGAMSMPGVIGYLLTLRDWITFLLMFLKRGALAIQLMIFIAACELVWLEIRWRGSATPKPLSKEKLTLLEKKNLNLISHQSSQFRMLCGVIWSIHPYSITTVAKKDIIALLNGLQP